MILTIIGASLVLGCLLTYVLFFKINKQEKHPFPIINLHYKTIKSNKL